jgi:ABC-type lipoprotein export system ATPase subunit
MLQTNQLNFKYPGGQALSFPDIHLGKNTNLLITGNSGSGKTTLLHLLTGILSPSSGSITINETVISSLSQDKMDAFRGKYLGLIFQNHLFISSLLMLDNLLLAQTLPGLPKDRKRLETLAEELSVAPLLKKRPHQLSRGEQQRFSVVRALANQPLVLFADEPTSSLDDENCDRFISLLKTTGQNHNLALVIATHDARLKSHFVNIVNLKSN